MIGMLLSVFYLPMHQLGQSCFPVLSFGQPEAATLFPRHTLYFRLYLIN
jgi:hypothetical protein